MATTQTADKLGTSTPWKLQRIRYMWKYRTLYFLALPPILYFVVFKYIPMFGSIIAFKNYNIFKGILDSPWAGMDHFRAMLEYPEFRRILSNTLLINLYDLLLSFPAPIVLALLLNEIRSTLYKKWVQTVIYMPHFLSWVIVSGIVVGFLSPSSGMFNTVLGWFGAEPIYFMGDSAYIRSIIIGSGLWRDIGWGTIIYLAALAGIHPDLYEAAEIDGAGRFQQTVSITLPALLPTIAVLFMLKIGHFMDFGFERVFVFLNPLNSQNGEIIDTYIYKAGLLEQQYSYTTAIGLFNSVLGLLLVFLANHLHKKATGESLY
ncbi:ABC transporter permease subunit [Paenibacillus sp. GD4]|uniref:ABC transporter permease n=1 Tax=Paenibacillus sp. GD4 TaxID=3068890 RepID=UPI0027964191|nr:ABC transporter permease subunit [Paenibacillus sp. GD4]MDQ1913411.1 ABC transporter permease subunit [Paenibacillus sp. GD4]